MKKTLITLLALSGIAMGATTFTDMTAFNNVSNPHTITLTSGDTLKMSSTAGAKLWNTDPPTHDAWTNAKALTQMNADLDTTITAEQLVSYKPASTGSGSSNTSLTLNVDSIAVGETIVLYTLISANNSLVSNFAISGLGTGYTVEYATNAGNGFVTTPTYSDCTYNEYLIPTLLNQTLVRVTGSVTANDIVLSAEKGNKNMWSMLAYAPYTVTPDDNVPEPTTATLSLLALAGLAARRRRK